MPTLLHPGVYVSEVPSGARSIEGAPTSTTIFVGETERGPIGPTKIKSRSDYERLFGGYFRVRDDASPPDDPTRVLMTYAMDGYFLNGGSTAYVLRAMDDAATRSRPPPATTSWPARPGSGVTRSPSRSSPRATGTPIASASPSSTSRPRTASQQPRRGLGPAVDRPRRRELRRRRPQAQPLHPLDRAGRGRGAGGAGARRHRLASGAIRRRATSSTAPQR